MLPLFPLFPSFPRFSPTPPPGHAETAETAGCLQDLENKIVGYCRILKDNFSNFVGLEVGKM